VIRDDFAGPGGWDEGLRLLGRSDVIGVEWDEAASLTRRAAGHLTIRADVATIANAPWAVEGYIASPPCQAFSNAGKQEGLADLPVVLEAAAVLADGGDSRTEARPRCKDPRSLLVVEPVRQVRDLRPRWVALEQVPPVLPLWEEFARVFRSWGYSVWTGILNAADFGVPQTRRRAVLMASIEQTALPPEPTHAECPAPSLFGPDRLPWVTMASALGWHPSGVVRTGTNSMKTGRESHDVVPYERSGDRPAPTLDSMARAWVWTQPATTIAGDPRITARCHHEEGSQGSNAKTTEQVRAGDYEGTEPIKLTEAEAAVLQSFPVGYPWQGVKSKRFEQIGNAVPPVLAAHVVAALTGVPAPSAEVPA
jgi:DNA (cytosine-5)-methyltransferase 1